MSDEELDGLFTSARKEASRVRKERARGCQTALRRFRLQCSLTSRPREKSVAAKCLNLAESGLFQICVSREVLRVRSVSPETIQLSHDEDDDPYINLAVAADVDFIVI